MEKRLKTIFEDYKKLIRNNPDQLIEYCKELELHLAIRKAATAKFKDGKKHSHQQLIPDQTLKDFADNLVQNIGFIEKASNFSDLYDEVERFKVSGIGDLAVYDTSQRIGANKGLTPDHIYLHRGTLIGLKKLMNLPGFNLLLSQENLQQINLANNKISKTSLPSIFHDLTCGEIEDILCIYKDDFDPHVKFKRKSSCWFFTRKRNIECYEDVIGCY